MEAKFFDEGAAEVNDILDGDFGNQGLDIDIEHEDITCSKWKVLQFLIVIVIYIDIESSRMEEHVDITAGWNH